MWRENPQPCSRSQTEDISRLSGFASTPSPLTLHQESRERGPPLHDLSATPAFLAFPGRARPLRWGTSSLVFLCHQGERGVRQTLSLRHDLTGILSSRERVHVHILISAGDSLSSLEQRGTKRCESPVPSPCSRIGEGWNHLPPPNAASLCTLLGERTTTRCPALSSCASVLSQRVCLLRIG